MVWRVTAILWETTPQWKSSSSSGKLETRRKRKKLCRTLRAGWTGNVWQRKIILRPFGRCCPRAGKFQQSKWRRKQLTLHKARISDTAMDTPAAHEAQSQATVAQQPQNNKQQQPARQTVQEGEENGKGTEVGKGKREERCREGDEEGRESRAAG